MPELVLHPKLAVVEGSTPLHSPMIVGDPSTVWVDSDDATYGWSDNPTSTTRGSYPNWADPDGGDPTLDRTTVTGIAVRARLRLVLTEPDPSTLYFAFELDGNVSKDLAYSTGFAASGGGGFIDYEWLVGYDQWRTAGWAPNRIQSALDQSYIYPRIWPVTNAAGDTLSTEFGIQVAEQSVVLYYGEIPPPVGVARRGAPLRQFPRDDGRQTATALRNFPRPKSYQSSIRRGGGYL